MTPTRTGVVHRLAALPQGAEIPRRYAAVAPGARPHLGLGPKAPLDGFRRIAPRHPVFRILRADGCAPEGHGSAQG
ncbi:hypothetical protein [Nonomuraea sp. NPDC052265]|uniref:hypothetical protein n=1 Tax=Nonomuraea sp. NPDC052265 TaxID=3364374 RepID=UPI0037CA1356